MQPFAPVQMYTPFVSGKYDVSPGLNHVSIHANSPHERLLQIDCQWPRYQQNKQACRQENIRKYYLEQELSPDTRQAVQDTLIRHLCQDYPQYFQRKQQQLHCQLTGDVLPLSEMTTSTPFEHPKYLSLLDGLAAQIQEDLAVWQLNGEHDSLAALHVCAPNHWAPAKKIGLNFDRVHASVPGMENQRQNYVPMLRGLIHKPAFYRFIWDFKSNQRLNHHPEAPAGISAKDWAMAEFQAESSELFVRVERQVLYGLPPCNAVLFTIRTYLYPVLDLDLKALQGLHQALTNMSPELMAYKNIQASQAAILSWLKERITQLKNNTAPSRAHKSGPRKPNKLPKGSRI